VPTDDPDTKLPMVVINELNFNNILIDYNSVPDKIMAAVSLGEFGLDLPKADLAKNEVDIKLLTLKNSDIALQLPKDGPEITDSTAITGQKPNFSWPDFFITADKISLENNSVQYRLGNTPSNIGHFDPDNIALSNLNLNAAEVHYQAKNAELKLARFSFLERSGFTLEQLAMDVVLNDT